MSRVPPELIGLDNVMEDFWSDYKRRTTRIVQPDELPEGHYWAPVPQYVAPKKPWVLKCSIAMGLLGWVWYEAIKLMGWLS